MISNPDIYAGAQLKNGIDLNDRISILDSSVQVISQTRLEMPTIQSNPLFNKAPLMAIGIRPNSPTLYFDIDTQYQDQPEMNIVNKEMRKRWVIPTNSYLEIMKRINPLYNRILLYKSYKAIQFFNTKLSHMHWAIYKTKHGWQYVHQFPTWDKVQYGLRELKMLFPRSNYIMNARKLRLRLSPKWNKVTGEIQSPEPLLYNSCDDYEESRIGTTENYYTYD